MEWLWSSISGLLLISMLAGFWRTLRGPTAADRLLGIQMNGTTGIALLLVFAQWQQLPALRDVALVLAVLAAAVTVGVVQILRNRQVGD